MLGLLLLVTAAPPVYVDDAQVQTSFTDQLGKLADKALPAAKLRPLVDVDGTCKLDLPPPPSRRLDPEDVYDAAADAVLVFGSVVGSDGEYEGGRLATAWPLTADGVVVTNWHVLDGPADGERFGAMTRDGRTFPLVGVLAVNKAADLAVVKLDAKGLTPLPLAAAPPRVGAWVGIVGHPGDRYWSFTQGHVSRYTTQKREDGPPERWMSVTAAFAFGSSGSPVLDRFGAVVGLATLTESLDYPADEPDPKDKKAEPDPASRQQMVVRLATPLADLRRAVGLK